MSSWICEESTNALHISNPSGKVLYKPLSHNIWLFYSPESITHNRLVTQSTVCWLWRYLDKKGKFGHKCQLPSSQTWAFSALLQNDLPQASSKHKMVQTQLTSEPFPNFKITVVSAQGLTQLYIKIYLC